MSDQHLRELERISAAGADPEAQAAFLRARLRSGTLSQERVRLAAYCGDETARELEPYAAKCETVSGGSAPRGFGLAKTVSTDTLAAGHWTRRFLKLAKPLGDKTLNLACRWCGGRGWVGTRDHRGSVGCSCEGRPRTITVPWTRWLAVKGYEAVGRLELPLDEKQRGWVWDDSTQKLWRVGCGCGAQDCNQCWPGEARLSDPEGGPRRALNTVAIWLKEPTEANVRMMAEATTSSPHPTYRMGRMLRDLALLIRGELAAFNPILLNATILRPTARGTFGRVVAKEALHG